jgi:photosystem II stability/assembly factor-like uncharacterized protein
MMAPLAAKRTLISLAQAGGKRVAVGDRGHILISTDGKAWQQMPSPADVMLNRVRFRDDKNGFALGHDATILATHDGGASWSVVHFDATSRPLYDLAFVDEQHLFALGGYGLFLDSADGGESWTPREFDVGALGQHFNAVTALGDGSLLVAGEKGLLMRSTDHGATWTLLDTPYTGSFFGVQPLGARGVIAYGLRGNIYVADDVTRCPTLKSDGYDNRDQLWKVQEAQLLTIPFIPTVSGIPEIIYDLQTKRYFLTTMTNEDPVSNFEISYKPEQFQPAALQRRAAKR